MRCLFLTSAFLLATLHPASAALNTARSHGALPIPNAKDADDDGLEDGTEKVLGLNPADPTDGLIDAELRASLDASDLDSEQLLSTALNRNLQTLFARQPRAASPLQGPVATAIEGLLARLDQQGQWRYGLRPCGEMLQVALIERDGPKRQLWELQAGGNGQITATLVEPLHHGS